MPEVFHDVMKFLSTPSARRATLRRALVAGADAISIHALREEGDQGPGALYGVLRISIHALREEGDVGCRFLQRWFVDFYPRPPRGGRRDAGGVQRAPVEISIHALREEGD